MYATANAVEPLGAAAAARPYAARTVTSPRLRFSALVAVIALVASAVVASQPARATTSSTASGQVTMAAKALRTSRNARAAKKTLRVCAVNPGQNRVCRTKVVEAPIPVSAADPAVPIIVPASVPVESAAEALSATPAAPVATSTAPAAAPAPVPVDAASAVKGKGGIELNPVPLMAKINDYRQANGRSYLPRSATVASGSLAWSYEMADKVAIKHDPTLTVGLFENVHGNWGWVESCATAVADLGTVSNRVFEAFRTSPSHNQNMLGETLQTQGAAMVCVPDGEYGSRIYVTSRFSSE